MTACPQLVKAMRSAHTTSQRVDVNSVFRDIHTDNRCLNEVRCQHRVENIHTDNLCLIEVRCRILQAAAMRGADPKGVLL